MSEFVRVRIPETGAEWFCHPMTAEAHGLPLWDDSDDDGTAGPDDLDDPDDGSAPEIGAPQQDSARAE